jgi:hypothetical protein
MGYRRDLHEGTWAFAALVAAPLVLATSLAWVSEGSIRVTSVDAILKQNPLQAGWPRNEQPDHPIGALQEERISCQPYHLARPSSTGGSSSPPLFSSPW